MNIASSFNDIAEKYRFSGRAMSQEEQLREQVEARLGLRPSAYARHYEDEQDEKKQLEKERHVHTHIATVQISHSVQQAHIRAKGFLDGELAKNLGNQDALNEQIEKLKSFLKSAYQNAHDKRTEIAQLKESLAENEQSQKALTTEIAVAETVAEQAVERAEVAEAAAGDKLTQQEEFKQHAQNNALRVEGSDSQFYVADYHESFEPLHGMAQYSALYIADADGNVTNIDDLPPEEAARHRQAIQAHVEGGGMLWSQRTAIDGIHCEDKQVAAAVEARQEADTAQENLNALRDQQMFLATHWDTLRTQITAQTEILAQIEADTARAEGALEGAEQELATLQTKEGEIRQIFKDMEDGKYNAEGSLDEKIKSMGLGNQWDSYNKLENHPFIDFVNSGSANRMEELRNLHRLKKQLDPVTDAEDISGIDEKLAELKVERIQAMELRNDIMNNKLSPAELDQKMTAHYGEEWTSYRDKYLERPAAPEAAPVAATHTPVASSVSVAAPVASAASEHDPSGNIGVSGITATAFNTAVTGVPINITPTPSIGGPDMAAIEQQKLQQQNNMGMGGGGMMG